MKNLWQWILSIFLTFTLISCGGSSDDSAIAKGVVYDDVVVGLDYQTKDFSGKTNDKGEFNYKEGEVKFYLKNLYIGKIPTMPKDNKVFLSDILNTKRGDYRSKEVVKLARLLQSLDATSPNDEKITLNQEKIEELFSSNQTLDKLDLTKLNLAIVPKEEAKKRVRDTLVREGITPIDNIKPTAKAGENQTAQEGENITLDGSKSTDTDGSIVKYEWLKGTTSLSTEKTYTTNSLSVGEHTITLKVTDDEGAVGSQNVTITITAKPQPKPSPSPSPISANKPPIANAGADQTAKEGEDVTLDGSSSTDSDGSIVKYEWFDANNNSLHVGASFTKNDFAVGTHTITLKVTDDKGASSQVSVTITVVQKQSNVTIATNPMNTAIDVEPNKNLTITFSSSMDNATLIKSNIILEQGASSIDYNLTKSGNTLTLNPTNLLEFNKVYTLTLSNAIKDSAGGYITQTVISFTIRDKRLSKVLRTGQTKSYDQAGNEVVDDSLKDDGYYARKGLGVARSYSRDDVKNIVKDNATGLEWEDTLDNEREDMNWTQAKEHCDTLALDGGGWRMPNANELLTLSDYSRSRGDENSNNSTLDPVFKHYVVFYNLLSDKVNTNNAQSWYANLNDPGSIHDYWDKARKASVRCVRKGEKTRKNFVKDEKTGIIFDPNTNLFWMTKWSYLNWIDAINYCENMERGGYKDWRLPNANELYSIYNREKYYENNGFYTIFTDTHDYSYFTSTTVRYIYNGISLANAGAIYRGKAAHPRKKAQKSLVKCVRSDD